ncbi:MAG: nitroreductase family protein [Magnetococcales bacterium]|nr:nitroreductase family protein [Magnetococcales bacterium]
MNTDSTTPGATVEAYHRHSKHQPDRHAPGPGHLDWANQPDPFRTHAGAPLIQLPLVADRLTTAFDGLYTPPGEVPVASPHLASVAALLELSLGLSAWKVHGDSRWALRCNPSSGNLHPTEGYVVLPDLPTEGDLPRLEAGVYHYLSRDHRLEQRRTIASADRAAWNALFPPGTLLMGLTSIPWREAWKYGDRAFRYVQLDTGHAASAIRHAAATLGWRARLLTAPATRDVARLLGMLTAGVRFGDDGNTPEAEEAELLLLVEPSTTPWRPLGAAVEALADLAARGPWLGVPNRLSRRHGHAWPHIETMTEATVQPRLEEMPPWSPNLATPLPASANPSPAAALIRQRRSAQRFDPAATLAASALWRLLDATLPRAGAAPWDALPWAPRLFPVFMLHRVTGVEAGLYILLRDPRRMDELKAALGEALEWSPVTGAPEHLPFYRLRCASLEETAYWISCQQEIASDGVLTLGMLGGFPEGLTSEPWLYRQLYWEAGMVGQTLYLEAEAAGMRGTGIGCFLDDLFHQVIGLRSNRFQSLYHFTLGRPIVDSRLRTEAPYGG